MSSKPPFEKVVAEHGATVLRVCRVLLASHDADDAWSETFLAALRAYPGLPEIANVEAWLVTIAHRKAIDVLHARKRHPASVAELPEQPTQLGIPDTGDELWRAVRELPDKQRQAMAYHYAAGLPYAETAQILVGHSPVNGVVVLPPRRSRLSVTPDARGSRLADPALRWAGAGLYLGGTLAWITARPARAPGNSGSTHAGLAPPRSPRPHSVSSPNGTPSAPPSQSSPPPARPPMPTPRPASTG